MTTRIRSLIAIVCAVWLAGPAPAGEAITARQVEVYRATCTHYENRSDALASEEDALLVDRLASSCGRALDRLTGAAAGPETRRRARAYLARLAELKATVVEMNMRRLFGPSDGPVRTVSLTGEYLIAQRMGILGALDEFAGRDVDLAVGE
ncbi:hypothetical protein P1J78_05445 [Psychromarinibacter sp. C21-152]|uniref:Lysozyme inhibitor LprI N-terminal domain-containing protein n=1 Tax=Psychromarinibacter sediminicola TaxID=3033385 RepID=A0AAE3NPP2_9RHOB|nr:hypothetical protein [Psychromarinibacter sediminicola]MDF0600169.1 hypothetical protein [Psychromarinibacter sediminicola]